MVPSCVAVATTGQMSFVACGAGVIHLDPSSAVLLDDSSGNKTFSWTRETAAQTGVDPFWLELRAAANDHVQWTFVIPVGFVSLPTLTIWAQPSSSQSFTALMRCATPADSDDWLTKVWDSGNTGSLPSGGGLGTMAISMVVDCHPIGPGVQRPLFGCRIQRCAVWPVKIA